MARSLYGEDDRIRNPGDDAIIGVLRWMFDTVWNGIMAVVDALTGKDKQ